MNISEIYQNIPNNPIVEKIKADDKNRNEKGIFKGKHYIVLKKDKWDTKRLNFFQNFLRKFGAYKETHLSNLKTAIIRDAYKCDPDKSHIKPLLNHYFPSIHVPTKKIFKELSYIKNENKNAGVFSKKKFLIRDGNKWSSKELNVFQRALRAIHLAYKDTFIASYKNDLKEEFNSEDKKLFLKDYFPKVFKKALGNQVNLPGKNTFQELENVIKKTSNDERRYAGIIAAVEALDNEPLLELLSKHGSSLDEYYNTALIDDLRLANTLKNDPTNYHLISKLIHGQTNQWIIFLVDAGKYDELNALINFSFDEQNREIHSKEVFSNILWQLSNKPYTKEQEDTFKILVDKYDLLNPPEKSHIKFLTKKFDTSNVSKNSAFFKLKEKTQKTITELGEHEHPLSPQGE